MKHRIFKITNDRFLEWYYSSGQDTENAELIEDLGKMGLNQLSSTGVVNITTQDIFGMINQEAIRVSFLEGYEVNEDNYDKELSDIIGTDESFIVELIPINKPNEIVVNFTENDAEDLVVEARKGIDHFATWSYALNGVAVDVKITMGDDPE